LIIRNTKTNSISGTIFYPGPERGNFILNLIPVNSSLRGGITGPMDSSAQSYSSYVLETGTYTVSVFLDINLNGTDDPGEPSGIYDADGDGKPDEVRIKGKVTGIDITLY
jgi:hypothetical protein